MDSCLPQAVVRRRAAMMNAVAKRIFAFSREFRGNLGPGGSRRGEVKHERRLLWNHFSLRALGPLGSPSIRVKSSSERVASGGARISPAYSLTSSRSWDFSANHEAIRRRYADGFERVGDLLMEGSH